MKIPNRVLVRYDTRYLYPSLFVFDQIVTSHVGVFGFAWDTYEIAQCNGLLHEDIVNFVKDSAIVPVILTTDADPYEKMDLYHELLSARTIVSADKVVRKILGDSWSVDNYYDKGFNNIVRWPRKFKKQMAEILDSSASYTKRYKFIQLFPPVPFEGESQTTRKWRESQKVCTEMVGGLQDRFEKLKSAHPDLSSHPGCNLDDFAFSLTYAKVFNCCILSDNRLTGFFKELLMQTEEEMQRIPELKRMLLESKKISAFKKVMNQARLRVPCRLHYDDIRSFRKDSAHAHLNEWLNRLYCKIQEEGQPLPFDERIILEFTALSDSLQKEISRRSAITTAILTASASYLTALHPEAVFAAISSFASYLPLTYFLTRLYRKVNKNNFVFYFMKWKTAPIRL